MSTREKLIKARLGMLALAEELQNITLACKRAGISRSHVYEIKDAFERFGAEGLAPTTRRRPRMPNETPAEVVARILEMTERFPTSSYLRISQPLRLVGVGVTPAAVRAVWVRPGLTLRHQRLLWLEQKTAAQGGVLTEAQLKLLRRWQGKSTDPRAHIEAPRSGFLLCQDTSFVGTIKGVGRISLQSVVDAHCSLAFGKLYLSKVPMTAVDVLRERVVPFYEEHGVDIDHLLTDNGREYCGRPLSHPFELGPAEAAAASATGDHELSGELPLSSNHLRAREKERAERDFTHRRVKREMLFPIPDAEASRGIPGSHRRNRPLYSHGVTPSV